LNLHLQFTIAPVVLW